MARGGWRALGLFAALATGVPVVATAEPVVVDRTVVRFVASETGGVRAPRFIYARELAFEARLEALADPDHAADAAPLPRHVRAALERHVAETLLASSRIDPPPSDAEIAAVTRAARSMLADRAGGAAKLRAAADAEQVGEQVLPRIAARQARASLYVDRMVAPMLAPTEAELRTAHRQSQYRSLPFDEARPAVQRWVVSRRLTAAVAAHYQAARSRIAITILEPAG
ncbi:MAG TPA: hypothetical protein PLU22_01350 [Polyangiaceae bacterium]|nr:hypothetical protein [Polyangiaceae bacterium]